MRTWAFWASFTVGMEASSTSISASTLLMSETVSRTVPAWFWMPGTAVSPSSILRAVTTPSMGAEMVEKPSPTWDWLTLALAMSARRRAVSSVARAVSKAVLACSKSAVEMMPASRLAFARSKSDFAWLRLAVAEARSERAAWRLAFMASALALALRGSISMRNWPLLTRSPSLTANRVTWPMTLAEMSALVTAWILPLALTLDSRFSRPTAREPRVQGERQWQDPGGDQGGHFGQRHGPGHPIGRQGG